MDIWRRKRTKNGDQGHLPVSGGLPTVGHELPPARGPDHDAEHFSRQTQVALSSVLPKPEDDLQKEKEGHEAPIPQENRQNLEPEIEGNHPNALQHMPQQVTMVQHHQGQQPRSPIKANAPNDHAQVRNAPSAQNNQQRELKQQERVGAPSALQSQPHEKVSNQVPQRQNPQSEPEADAVDTTRDPSPEKKGKGHRLRRTLQRMHPDSDVKRSTSNRMHSGKGSQEKERNEHRGYEQKRLPEPPRSLSTQTRTDVSQSQPGKPQVRSVVPLGPHDGHHKPGMSRQKSDPSQKSNPSQKSVEHQPDSPRVQIPVRSVETGDTHAWERYLPQSADDASIKHEVLTLFEFIEHHVDGYYYDRNVEISQAVADQLEKLESSHLPKTELLEDLLEQAQYQGPIIKHCLINLVVSGMSFEDSAPFSFLPEEFTVLPRAIKTARAPQKPYHDQALSKFRSSCIHLRPNVQEDANYIRKLDDTIDRAVGLCMSAFAPWARNQVSQDRQQHLTSLFHNAANVGILLFSQPSSFVFNWKSSEKPDSGSEIRVWPRLLRTTNPEVELLAKPQVIVESSSQHIGLRKKPARQLPNESPTSPNHKVQGTKDVYELSGTDGLETRFEPPSQGRPHIRPSELPAPDAYVSATVKGPQNAPHPYAAPKYPPEQQNQDWDPLVDHSVASTSQYRVSDQDARNFDAQNRPSPSARKPVNNAATRT